MTRLTVLEYPDPRLRTKAKAVVEFDAKLKSIVDDMFETMYAEEGVGLAATQVNIHLQIIAMDASPEGNTPICLINPEIIYREGMQFENEGCLSLPGVYDQVERAAKIRFRAQDIHGDFYEMDAEELTSICVQHEMDHLVGILFIDHLSRLRQERLRKKMVKLKRQAVNE